MSEAKKMGCVGFGRIFGHRYKARYDSSLPYGIKGKGLYPEHLEASRTKVYRGDVCVRCGRVVNVTPQVPA